MVNIKYLSLPLLVGLFVTKARATCTLELAVDGNSCTASADCTANDNGYYDKTTKIVKYNHNANQKCQVMSNKGLYLLASGTEIKEIKDASIDPFTITTGYFKDANNEYFSCTTTPTSKCFPVVLPTDGCKESNIGKLVQEGNKVGLCLAYYKNGESMYNPLLEFISTSVSAQTITDLKLEDPDYYTYFVQHKEKESETDVNRVMNFDDKANYYALKRSGYNQILFNNGYTSDNGKMDCADGKTGQRISTKQDFCSTTSSGKYFLCTNGICDSFIQSNWEVKEVNDKKCVCTKSAETITCTGNCETGQKYLLNSISGSTDVEIVDSESSQGKVYTLNLSGSSFTTAIVEKVGYFVNGDQRTKTKYPLIKCTTVNTCELITPTGLGYYITSDATSHSIIACSSQSKCEDVSDATSCTFTGGVIVASHTVKLCERSNSAGIEIKYISNESTDQEITNQEIILLNVSEGNFPGVKKVGHYIVKMYREKGNTMGTIILVDMSERNKCEVDNVTIQAEDGNFYYCAGGIQVPYTATNPAKFAIKINNEYKVVQMSDNKVNEIEVDANGNDMGNYYINRSSGATGLVKCEKEEVDNVVTYKWVADDNVFDSNGFVYKILEENFPTSATNKTPLEAKIVVCESSKCKVPIKEGDKYMIGERKLEKYFTNSNKDLIIYDKDNDEFSVMDNENDKDNIKEGYYINGAKDLSFIKCKKVEEEEVHKSTDCAFVDIAKTDSYFVGVNDDNGKLIHCGDIKCSYSEEEFSSLPKTYLNGDSNDKKRIIECTDNSINCISVEASGYYINDEKGEMNLIYCDNGSCGLKLGRHRGVYISGEGSKTTSNRLITCDSTENKCTIIKTDIPENPEYYLNGDSSGSRIITQVKVEVEDSPSRKRGSNDYYHWGLPDTALAKANALFLNGNAGSGNKNVLIHCTSESECKEVSPNSDTDRFIDVINGKIISKDDSWSNNNIVGSGTKYYLIDKSNGQLLFDGKTGSLVSCTKEEDWKCEVKSDDNNHYYLTENNKMIINNNNVFSIPSTYDVGYYINNVSSDIIQCTSVTNCSEYLNENSCSLNNAGSLSPDGKFCLGSDGATPPTSIETSVVDPKKVIVVLASGEFPGVSSGSIIVSIGNNKIVQVKEEAYYLVNPSNREFIGSGTDIGIVYKCNNAGTCDPQTQNEKKFYPNSYNGSNIICEQDTDDPSKKYYCRVKTTVSGEVYCSSSNKLYICKGNCNTSCEILQNKNGYYLPYGNNGIISCTGSSCPLKSDPKDGYYISQDISNPLIRCAKSNVGVYCEYVTASNGYYIGGDPIVKFIKCSNNICTDANISSTNTRNKWYISGEADKELIKCEKVNSGSTINLLSVAKPAVGWFINGDGESLIKCTTKNNSVKCIETSIPNEGYYINADEIYNNNNMRDTQKIIKCSSNLCSEEIVTKGSYYVNGNSKQLIYCDNHEYCYEESGNGWYISGTSSIIKCKNSVCVSNKGGELNGGLYINSDVRKKNENPLIKVNPTAGVHENLVELYDDIENGWYLNADESDEKKIIECKKGDIYYECQTKIIVSICSAANNGKFINDSGEIKWCNGNKSIKLENRDSYIIFNKFTSKLGWIAENNGIAVFNIKNDRVVQTSIDGYYYDEEQKVLYKCSKYGSKLCSEIDKPDPGYYVNYYINNNQSNKVIKCTGDGNEPCLYIELSKINNISKCSTSNIIVDEGIKMCLYDISTPPLYEFIKLEDVEEGITYALENRDMKFPKRSGVPQFRYFLATVGKYSIVFQERIKEVSPCPEEADSNADDKKVCLTANNQLVRTKDLKSTSDLIKTNIEISMDEKLSPIVYDADTNNGYFIYKYENRVSSQGYSGKVNILSKIFIKPSGNNVNIKYECTIGGVCVERAKADQPILGYQRENGILKRTSRDENGKSVTTEIKEKIMPGIYKLDSGNSNNVIECKYIEGEINCSSILTSNSGITIGNDGYLKVNSISCSKLYTKLLAISNIERRDGNNNNKVTIKALSSSSYNDFETGSLINIFVFGPSATYPYRIIKNDEIKANEESGIIGYICNSDEVCEILEKSGNYKYLLNSQQKGKKENAIAKCGGNPYKCEFINAKNNAVYENYAATGTSDALIKCTDTGCNTAPVSSVGKLPECKSYVNTVTGKKEMYDVDEYEFLHIEDGSSLAKDQHCIFENEIFEYNKNSKDISDGVFIFDATYRALSPTKIAENHYGATMYKCFSSGNCYVTYGYIINSDNNIVNCDISGCTIVKSTPKDNCKEAGKGALIKASDNKFYICTNDDKKNSDGAYPIDININGNFPETVFGNKLLVEITGSGKIFTQVVSDGYLLTNSNSKIQSTELAANEKNELYKCNIEFKECTKSEKLDGYYYSPTFEKMYIECSSSRCKMNSNNNKSLITEKIDGSPISFSRTNEKKYYEIETFPGNKNVIAESSRYSINVYKTDNYILLNPFENRLAGKNEKVDLDSLYKCNKSGGKCIKQKDVEDGWYISGQEGFKAIRCEKKACIMYDTLGSSCSGNGDFIFTSNDYNICIPNKKPIKISQNVGSIYDLTTTGSTKLNFPNKKTYVVINTNSVIGTGYIDGSNTPRGIATCSDVNCKLSDGSGTLKGNEYCIFGNAIYANVTNDQGVYGCTKQFTNGINVEVFYSKTKIESNASDAVVTKKGTQMYYCNKGSCKITAGYMKINNKGYKCDFVGCDVTASGTPINGEMKSNILYTQSGNQGFSADENRLYKYIEGYNLFPGTEKLSSFLVEIGSNYMVPFVTGNGYYLIDSNGKMKNDDPKEGSSFEQTLNNSLYLCDNIDGNCILQTINENAFIYNAASSTPTKTSIIKCSEGKCVIANGNTSVTEYKNIIFTGDTCNGAGQLLRNTNTAANGSISFDNYKLCIANRTSPVSVTVSKSKYYMIEIGKGDAFADIVYPNTEESNEKKRNVLIEVSPSMIHEVQKEGYILFDQNGNNIVTTVNDSKSSYKLFYCKNNIDGTTKSYSCNQITTINNGWYISSIFNNGDKRLIRCVNKECGIIEAKESNKCIETGSIIYNDGFKLCQTLKKQTDISSISNESDGYSVVMNVSLGKEFPGITVNNTDILISIEPMKIVQIKMNTNIITNEEKTVIEEMGKRGILYTCAESGQCVQNLQPLDNWYLKKNVTGYNNELIECRGRRCKLYTQEVSEGFNDLYSGFRISANINKPLIQCVKVEKEKTDTPGEYEQIDKTICFEKDYNEGWFINARNSNGLIKCTLESACKEKNSVTNGFYINAGASSTYNFDSYSKNAYSGIIKCSDSGCEEYKSFISGNTCTKGGDIINPSKGNYQLCKEAGKAISFSGNTYDVINNEGSFPVGNGDVVVKISGKEIVVVPNGIYYISQKMYKCSEGTCTIINGDDKNDVIVRDDISMGLYIAECSDGECKWIEKKIIGNVFLDSNSKLVTAISDTISIDMIYECLGSSKLVCTDKLTNNVEGFFFNNEIRDENNVKKSVLYNCKEKVCTIMEDINKCTLLNYKSNICYISFTDEPYTEDLEENQEIIYEPGSVCVSDSGKYYFAISEINTGINKVNCVPMDNFNGYVKIEEEGYVNRYFYENTYGVSEIFYPQNIIDGLNINTVITNDPETSAVGRVLKGDDNSLISCTGNICKKSNLLTCSYNYKNEKCTGNNIPAGDICVSAEGNIYLAIEKVTSSGGKCVRRETAWGYSIGDSSLTPDYSVDDYSNSENTSEINEETYHLIDGKIYKFKSNNNVYIQDEGVYLIDNANKLVDINNESKVDITTENVKMYVCTSSGCKVKSTCTSVNTYEYIYSNGKIIRCDPSNNKINYESPVNGYYLNSPWENLIKCTNGSCYVKSNDEGMPGYFVDSGNSNKIIKCIRNNERMKCQLEDPVVCSYDIKKGMCISSVDLLRNSYCYVNEVRDQKSGKLITPGKMLYIENFIRALEFGKCIANDGNDVFFYHYRKSKFLGNKERDEVIRYSQGAIESIYEKELGYYIITTDTRKGITNTYTKLNKSRLYECTSTGCKEIRKPEKHRIYVNKASDSKLIIYNGNEWKVINNLCKKSITNPGLCDLPNSNIKKGDLIYIIENDKATIYASKVNLNTKATVIKDNNEIIDKEKYQSYNEDLYLMDKSEQFFDIVNESGYYIFNRRGTENYKFNLEPFRNTINTTVDASEIVIYNNGWSNGISKSERYYWNKADLKKEGIVVEIMNVPSKLKPKEEEEQESKRKREINEEIDEKSVNRKKREDEDTPIAKVKAVLNGCISNTKGTCQPIIDGQKLKTGDACIVVDGDNRGLYLITDKVEKNSKNKNCMKYDGETTYFYIGNEIEFISELHNNIIAEVKENVIVPFDKNNSEYDGLFVIDKNERKLLNSTSSTNSFNAYNCTWVVETVQEEENIEESRKYKCNTFALSNKYYVSKGHYKNRNSFILTAKDGKMAMTTTKGYYFFNENYTPATITIEGEGENAVENSDLISTEYTRNIGYSSMNQGTYLNAAADNNILVRKTGSKEIILKSSEYKVCSPSGETCNKRNNSDVNKDLIDGDVCVATISNKKSLYLVLVEEGETENDKKVYCYTGSDKVKYRFVSKDSMLYKMDGLSVQEVDSGYYIFNANWEEFSATYPDVPKYIIYCEAGSCKLVTETIDIESEVIFNMAATGNNKLLRYYPTLGKFVNVFKPGYYLVSHPKSEVTNDSGYYSHKYYLNEKGVLSATSLSSMNIYINNAKEGYLTRNGRKYEGDSNVKYNAKTGGVEYNGYVNIDEKENVYIIIDGVLYKQLFDSFVVVDDGLYAIVDERAFTSNEWTTLKQGTEICYSVDGYCNQSKLNDVIINGYAINKATKKESVIQYDQQNEKWRIVNETGVYFFFEDGNSLSLTDRRIDRVMEVVDGDAIDITKDENRFGFYKYQDLMIESDKKNGWEDAVVAIRTVESSNRRVCNSYESNEIINSEKFCFNSNYGVCLPKIGINNEPNENNNCVFSDSAESYYILIDDEKLYSISDHSFKNIVKDGLYIVDKNKKVFKETIESKATAYSCESGLCKIENELATGYYLNMANGGTEEPVILYYNKNSKTWRTVIVNGYYFFNKKGYGVRDGEEINAAYLISDEGEIELLQIGVKKGIYVNQSNGEEAIVVEYGNKWEKAKKVAECKIVGEGKVNSSSELKAGDICLDGKVVALIKESNISEETKEKREEIFTYDAVISSNEESKYSFNASNKSIVKLEDGKLVSLDVIGYVIIDDKTSLPVSGKEAVKATAYKCDATKCDVVDKLTEGKRLLNAISDTEALVRYIDGKWLVENEPGYYFFGSDVVPVTKNGIVLTAIEVEVEPNGNILQRDITNVKELGFYLNKASTEKIIVSSNNLIWSKGATLQNCNVTAISEVAVNCRTLTKDTTLDAGEYCYDKQLDMIYLLTKTIDDSNEEDDNCVSGSNEEPIYLTNISTLNGEGTDNKLTRLNDDSIKVVSSGIYILNVNGTLVEDNDDGDLDLYIWNCNDSECVKEENIDINIMFLDHSNEIYVFVNRGEEDEVKKVLTKVTGEGIYFFNEEGKGCSKNGDIVNKIIEIAEDGSKTEVELDKFAEGAYINGCSTTTLAIYKNEEWTIVPSECKINEEDGSSCESSVISMEVGSYCIIDGYISIVSEIDEENSKASCISGDDSNPLYKMEEDGTLYAIKRKTISIVNKEGYYAINTETLEGLRTEKPTSSLFIKCNNDGECVKIKPEVSSNYLNKAVNNNNVVSFEKGKKKSAVTSEKHCIVEDGKCTVAEGEIESGEMCVANDSIYLVNDGGACIKAEKYVERLKFINDKIYRLIDDSVIQIFDGYYFMNGDNRVIGSVEDYSNPDTKCYMCSVKGVCFEIEPDDDRYYKDYATEVNGKFKVVTFSSKNMSKREGSSGYEIITEGGIYKLDDGSYVECEISINDEVSCQNIKTTGSKRTKDGEVLVCDKKEKKIECVQAVNGGYYYIDNTLLECDANEDGDALECKEIKKEGYFIADNWNALYKCVKEEVAISNVNLLELNGLAENEEIAEGMNKREENNAENNKTVNTNDNMKNNETENNTEISTTLEEETEVPTDSEEVEVIPVDVECTIIECVVNEKVVGEEGEELYICIKPTKEEKEEEEGEKEEPTTTETIKLEEDQDEDEEEKDGEDEEEEEEIELTWVSNECESGNHVKKGNFYSCEEKKEELDKEMIEKPNEEHISTQKTTQKTKTTSTETTTTIETTTTTTTTTTTVMTTTTEQSNNEEKTTTTKKTSTEKNITTTSTTQAANPTTKTASTSKTTTPTTPTTNESGSISMRSIPSLSIYVILFFIAIYLQF